MAPNGSEFSHLVLIRGLPGCMDSTMEATPKTRTLRGLWTSSDVLDSDLCNTFFVNNFTDRHMYMTIGRA